MRGELIGEGKAAATQRLNWRGEVRHGNVTTASRRITLSSQQRSVRQRTEGDNGWQKKSGERQDGEADTSREWSGG